MLQIQYDTKNYNEQDPVRSNQNQLKSSIIRQCLKPTVVMSMRRPSKRREIQDDRLAILNTFKQLILTINNKYSRAQPAKVKTPKLHRLGKRRLNRKNSLKQPSNNQQSQRNNVLATCKIQQSKNQINHELERQQVFSHYSVLMNYTILPEQKSDSQQSQQKLDTD